MSSHASPLEISRREARGSIRLWFGLLGGPISWITQLAVNYSLEEWFACSPGGGQGEEILGLSVQSLALAVSLGLASVTVLAGIVALRCFGKIRGEPAPAEGSRAGWMALAGIMNSVLYLILIVASFAPPLILSSCRQSP